MEKINYLRGKKKPDGTVEIKYTKINRFVVSKKEPNYNTKYAKEKINQELSSMKSEILQSEKSSSILIRKENSNDVSHRSFTESTFPEYMRKSGIGSSKDFLSVLNKAKGLRFERLKKVAIDRLNNGYQNKHGYDLTDIDFKKKTGQIYDNKNVIFRFVRGRVIRIKVDLKNRHDLQEDAPF